MVASAVHAPEASKWRTTRLRAHRTGSTGSVRFVWFKDPKLFAPREAGNSFYTSYLVLDGKGVLWYNDKKFYLCGRVIGPEWFD